MKIEKPIFIIGIGRSGSSIFYNMFSKHPDLAWMSKLCNKYPQKLTLNKLLMKMIDYPGVGNYLKRRANPVECYDFWEHHCKGI